MRGGTLHAVVNDQLAREGAREDGAFVAVQSLEVCTGRLLGEVRVDGKNALLGDLEIAGDGVVYVSDSRTPGLFRLVWPAYDETGRLREDVAVQPWRTLRVALSPP
jgi:hypothetical protein